MFLFWTALNWNGKLGRDQHDRSLRRSGSDIRGEPVYPSWGAGLPITWPCLPLCRRASSPPPSPIGWPANPVYAPAVRARSQRPGSRWRGGVSGAGQSGSSGFHQVLGTRPAGVCSFCTPPPRPCPLISPRLWTLLPARSCPCVRLFPKRVCHRCGLDPHSGERRLWPPF